MSPEDELSHENLRVLLQAAVVAPFRDRRWKTRRAKVCWSNAEVLLDKLAGPLDAIAHARSGCDYLYRDTDRWAHVPNTDALERQLFADAARLRDHVEDFRPRSPDEREDFDFLLSTLETLDEALRLAIKLERTRCATA